MTPSARRGAVGPTQHSTGRGTLVWELSKVPTVQSAESAESVSKHLEAASQNHVNHKPEKQKSDHGINNS